MCAIFSGVELGYTCMHLFVGHHDQTYALCGPYGNRFNHIFIGVESYGNLCIGGLQVLAVFISLPIVDFIEY